MVRKALALGALLFALCVSAEAQQPKKVPRIGYLTAVSLSAVAARTEAFRQGLRELGYVEGKNIFIEYRYAREKRSLPALADELVRLKVDVIVTGGAPATRCRQRRNAHDSHCDGKRCDPVGNGLSPAWRDPAEISLAYHRLLRTYAENGWSF